MNGRNGSLLRDPVFRAVTAAGGVLLLGAFAAWHYQAILGAACRLLHVLRPLLLGILFATMLSPSYERLRQDFTAFAVKTGRTPHAGRIRFFSLAGAMIPPLAVLCSVICILIPQVMESVRLLSENFGYYSGNLQSFSQRLAAAFPMQLLPAEKTEQLFSELSEKIPALLMKTYDYTAAVLSLLLDIGIGAVFSLYLLADKQRLRAELSAVCGRLTTRSRLRRMAARAEMVCATFARFLGTQCKEALILGSMCWLGMQVFRFPYPVLISVIIGITNIVPYVGPVIGLVPGLLLMLLVKPHAALWFVGYVIILQQIESNLIYPRVVGQSIGLPPAWVLAAIVICGGLFGAAGLLLGVPLAAVVYAVLFPENG